MANVFEYQIIKDTNREAVIKLTGNFDGSGDEANSIRIQANSLYAALDANNLPLQGANVAKSFYGLSLHRAYYDVQIPNGYVRLYWSGTSNSNTTLLNLHGVGEYNHNAGWASIPNNNLSANSTGNIGIETFTANADNSYTIILDLKKDNRYYDIGRFDDPAAFNYKPFGITP